VKSLASFLTTDDVVAEALRAATLAAGVDRASDELLVVEEEDVARLLRLGLDSFAKLRMACEQEKLVVSRLLAEWRSESESAITPQELLWALTYVLAAERGEAVEEIRALVSTERWWQRATESHRGRFLERIESQIAAARSPRAAE